MKIELYLVSASVFLICFKLKEPKDQKTGQMDISSHFISPKTKCSEDSAMVLKLADILKVYSSKLSLLEKQKSTLNLSSNIKEKILS